jgi:hypothetical protein
MKATVPTEFSPEAFIEHLSENNHAPWIRDEAAGVLSAMKREYMRGFKDSLMQLYDCRPFYRKLRTSFRKGAKTEFQVDDPYLISFWATTDAALLANTDMNDTLSGFMARILYHFPQGKKDKWLPLEEGNALNSPLEGVVVEMLQTIAQKIEEMEPMALHLSEEAAGYYVEWQKVRETAWIDSNDGHGMQIYSRLAPTVLKLAILYELGSPNFDPEIPIRLEYIVEACRMVDSYYLPTARTIYDSVGADAEKNIIDRIINFLKTKGGKVPKRDISRHVKIKARDLDDYLDTMITDGTIEFRSLRKGNNKGRQATWVILKLLSPPESESYSTNGSIVPYSTTVTTGDNSHVVGNVDLSDSGADSDTVDNSDISSHDVVSGGDNSSRYQEARLQDTYLDLNGSIKKIVPHENHEQGELYQTIAENLSEAYQREAERQEHFRTPNPTTRHLG